jgi:hypothetical protein
MHVEKWGPTQRTSLTNVKYITLSFWFRVDLNDEMYLEPLPRWITLLPCLEVLRLTKIIDFG